MEQKLLDLVIEYASHEDDAATLAPFGMEPKRTKGEIAAEYGRVLKSFLAS